MGPVEMSPWSRNRLSHLEQIQSLGPIGPSEDRMRGYVMAAVLQSVPVDQSVFSKVMLVGVEEAMSFENRDVQASDDDGRPLFVVSVLIGHLKWGKRAADVIEVRCASSDTDHPADRIEEGSAVIFEGLHVRHSVSDRGALRQTFTAEVVRLAPASPAKRGSSPAEKVSTSAEKAGV